jgi:hypothetical protein|tara:strand:+ start:2049 stop:2324 length:276 start_codon:yes stop_codon:yes gene_type:complete
MNRLDSSLVRSICEEFCDCVLVDDQNLSFLVYVKKKFHQPLSSRLAQLDIVEIFKNIQKNKIVVLYQILRDIDPDDLFFDEDVEDEDGLFG